MIKALKSISSSINDLETFTTVDPFMNDFVFNKQDISSHKCP